MTHTQNHFYPVAVLDGLNCWKFARATKRTPEWVIYNLKGYLNPRWRLVTIDLRSKSAAFWKRANQGTLLQIYLYKSSTITRSLRKVWLEILVAKLATNFQDLVAKAKNLVALAPVLGAILRPAIVEFHTNNYYSPVSAWYLFISSVLLELEIDWIVVLAWVVLVCYFSVKASTAIYL